VSISESRKSRAETPPIVSKSRRMQGRAVEAAMPHGHPFRVNTANLPRRRFLHLAAKDWNIGSPERRAFQANRRIEIVHGLDLGAGTREIEPATSGWPCVSAAEL
jgi:hypothetical protein